MRTLAVSIALLLAFIYWSSMRPMGNNAWCIQDGDNICHESEEDYRDAMAGRR